MAYASHTTAAPLSLTARFGEIIEHAREALRARRVYRQTVSELQALSNRDLNDLGISRSEIQSIALEAAYGLAR
jgi:uncharacterized protein YjiS (DUF1127 family)